MNRVIFPTKVFLVIFCLAVTCFTQAPTPNPNDSLPSLRQIEDNARTNAVRPGERDISRQAGKDRRRIEREKEPELDVSNEFALVRKRSNAKLVRLHPDFGCESKHTISVKADCADRIVGASKHTLRNGGLTPDIHYEDGKIVGDGFFSILMMTELNEASFENVGRETAPVKALIAFEAPTTFAGAKNVYQTLREGGITVEGILLRDCTDAVEGATFAIRVIAYKTKDLDLFKLRGRDQRAMFEFMALGRDKRVDGTFVAKVVRRSQEGVIHLLWREVERKQAPAIPFSNDEIPKDFRKK